MAAQALADERLYVAAENGEISVIEALFSSKPTPEINSVHKQMRETALHVAAFRGHLAVVKYLLAKDADQNVLDGAGKTAAHTICGTTHWDDTPDADTKLAILQLLFKKDRSIMEKKTEKTGSTCLHIATSCWNHGARLISWLLDAGADGTARDHDHNTPWDILIDWLHKESHPSNINSEDLEHYAEAYCILVREEMKSGDINNVVKEMAHVKAGGLDVFRLWHASVVGVHILLEYLMYLAPLRQAHQQIRQELFQFITTGNGRTYREPSCVFGISGQHHSGRSNTVWESLCTESTFENLKASISQPRLDAVRKIASFEVSKPVSFSRHDVDYLSLVVPIICVRAKWALNAVRNNVVKDFKFRSDDKADLAGYRGHPSIDEYCYPVLSEKSLARRNNDQTIARMPRHKDDLIVIDQAWIWLAEDVLIYTSLGGNYKFEADLLMRAGSSRYAQVGRFVATLICNNESERIFNAFQGYIMTLAEEVSSYIDREGIESITITAEKNFYHNINDAREELSMLRRILTQQEELWKTFASNVWPKIWADCQNGRTRYTDSSDPRNKMTVEEYNGVVRLIMQPVSQLQKSRQRILQLDEDAERVERSIANLLDLKQKHASLQDAHATAVISTAVFGFTVITIIFTPLSFVMSLFALPIDRFQRNQIPSRWTSDAGMYTTSYIGTWAATTEIVSIFLTILAMWLALEFGLKSRVALKVWAFFKDTNGRIYEYMYLLYRHPPRIIESLKREQLRSGKPRDEQNSATSRTGSQTVEAKEVV